MTAPEGIDFTRLEAIRQHMALRHGDMAKLLGVSRMSYYRWEQGYPMRPSTVTVLRLRTKNLLEIARSGFPSEEVKKIGYEERLSVLMNPLD